MVGGYLSGIFGSSPVRPLQEHMSRVVECAHELIPFTEAVITGDTEKRQRHHERIIALEQKADALKKDLRLHLPTSLFMPIDRRDVLEVLAMQDRVAGSCRNVAGIIAGRNMTLPESMRDAYMEFVATNVAAVEKAAASIRERDELIETGFDKSERELVSNTIAELDSVEQRTDEQAAALSQLLFGLEDHMPPVQVMFLYQVIDKTGSIADRAQRVGSRLQLMLAR